MVAVAAAFINFILVGRILRFFLDVFKDWFVFEAVSTGKIADLYGFIYLRYSLFDLLKLFVEVPLPIINIAPKSKA